ncbi:MAG: DNA mismatch repair protein MutS [Anaplasmataceae bacterium]|nr:DNA mismatch repair protein MutS [Anaplasmataceae bacterium]
MDSLTELKITPMMAQWHACKTQAQDAVLLFRLGDFYEGFHDDALLLSRELDLTLTKRGDIPMSGIPFHASESYIDRLVEKGFKVAIAEQMEDPKSVKGLVRRDIVRIVTPGTLLCSSLLKDKCPNYVASIQLLNTVFGLALLDLSTGDFRVMQLDEPSLLINELYRFRPKEFIVSAKCFDMLSEPLKDYAKTTSSLCSKKEEWLFEHRAAYDTLARHFAVHNLDGFGLKGMTASINAAGALLHYVNEDLSLPIDHIQTIRSETPGNFLAIDYTTQKHLELLEPLHEKAPSLLSHLDATLTPMGGRLVRDWLLHPLLDISEIDERQEAIDLLVRSPHFIDMLSKHLSQIRDIERLIMRISSGLALPRDLLALRESLEPIPLIKQLIKDLPSSFLTKQHDQLFDLSSLTKKIDDTLNKELPLRISDGGVIKSGVHAELDNLRSLQSSGHAWILNYQTALRESTGIRTLKVAYTKAFGYYIEVSRGQAEKMPADFVRRQTLVSTERFLSTELKEYEQKIFSAEETIQALETELFSNLREEVSTFAKEIRSIASAISCIDVLFGLATVARKHHYVRPTVDNSDRLDILSGRHPIIETCLPQGHFVPNDLLLDETQRLLLLTGPNMAGKSTFIRQIALIVIMAQMGSFVPAKAAHLGVIDKVFSRIGASDDLSRGQSTFMVEMSETANILHHTTSRSLVILDEIGRGTSTYDGIAIAWAVAEYLLVTQEKRAKTLFATHYWELHALEQKIPGAVNFKVAVAETDGGIAFLHKILRGKTDKSYGIHVAKLAGLPLAAIRKAQEILASLENTPPTPPSRSPSRKKQLDLFAPLPHEEVIAEAILTEIRECNIDQLTPLEALKTLAQWKTRLL